MVGPDRDTPVCVMCAKDIMGTPPVHTLLQFEMTLVSRNHARFGMPPGEFKIWMWAVASVNHYWVDG